MATEVDGKFALAPEHAHVVQYYANAIAHHFESDQLVIAVSQAR
jgi:hypothetical protein